MSCTCFKGRMLKIVFLLLFALIIFKIVYANGGPSVIEPRGTGYLMFDPNSGIALVEENITFICEDNPRMWGNKARVEVLYRLKNITPEEKHITMLFITPYSSNDNFTAVVNDKIPVEIERYNTQYREKPENWEIGNIGDIIEPLSGKPIKSINPKYRKGLPEYFTCTEIPLSFKPNELLKVDIKYNTGSAKYAGKGSSTLSMPIFTI